MTMRQQEFLTIVVEFSKGYEGKLSISAGELSRLFSEGWRICDQVICPPFAIIIFDRVKESENEQ